MRPAAVLFDLDNTLYEYAPCNTAALRAVHGEVARHLGTSWEEFRAAHDEVREELATRHAGRARSHDRALFFEGIARRLEPAPARSAAARWYELYWEVFLGEMRPAPRAHEVLAELSRALRLALVSNHMTAPQERKLARLGFEPYFEVVVTSEQVGVEKPDPRVFQVALEGLGTSVERAVMVGDDPRADIAGAHAAGLRTVQSLQFMKHGVRAESADAVIEDLGALPALLLGA